MVDFEGLSPLLDASDLSMPEGVDVEQSDLDAVCHDIRLLCGWHIAPAVEMEFVVNAEGGTILTVPTLEMGEPTSVVDRNGTEITGWSWSANGILEHESGCWPKGLRSVTVTAPSGYTTCPASIRAVIEDILADRASVKTAGEEYDTISHDGASITMRNPYGDGAPGVRRDPAAAYGHILGRYTLR
ncbi:head-to-tail adaptor [Gordonia phage Gudmit]|nr:head-to-tail adaptor [Gordonia phage Gudmit]